MDIDNTYRTEPDIIDESTLLARIPITSRTAREWRRRGILPFIKPPGSNLIVYHWPTVHGAMIRFQRGGAQ